MCHVCRCEQPGLISMRAIGAKRDCTTSIALDWPSNDREPASCEQISALVLHSHESTCQYLCRCSLQCPAQCTARTQRLCLRVALMYRGRVLSRLTCADGSVFFAQQPPNHTHDLRERRGAQRYSHLTLGGPGERASVPRGYTQKDAHGGLLAVTYCNGGHFHWFFCYVGGIGE